MTTHTQARRADFPVNRLLALGAWAIGCGATYSIIAVLLGPGAPWYIAAVTAIIVQALLTGFEWSMFVRGERTEASIIALIMDVVCNASGLYFPMTRLGQTAIGAMVADVSGAAATVSNIVAAILAIILGYLLARAPEHMWRG